MADRTAAALSVVAAAVLFGTAGAARELGPAGTTSLTLGAVRGALGALTLWWCVGRLPGRWLVPHLGPVVVGGLGVALYQPMFFVGVERTGVAIGTIVTIGSAPFFAGVLDWAVLGARPSRRWLVATLVTVAGGVVLVSARADVDGTVDVELLGVLAALSAGFGYAVYSTTSKLTIGRGLDSTSSLAAPFALGSVVLVLVSLGDSYAWLTSPGGVALALYLGVAATGVAYVLYGRGLRSLPSSTAVTLVLAEPVTASLLAVVVLGERLPPRGWMGVALVLVGLLLAGRAAVAPSLGGRRRARAATAPAVTRPGDGP